jgi:hypothetical protein
MKCKNHLTTFLLLLLVSAVLAACTDDSAGRNDPVVEAARNACRTQSGVDYDCVEQAAIAALNPDICRLAGISIDDMCLQAVYEAANDPSICDRIYLQGVVPNCRAYYAQFTSAATPPIGTSEKPALTQTPLPSYTPPPTATPTSQPTLTPSPTSQYVLDLSGYDPDIFPPIDISHNPPLIARSDETVNLVFGFANTFCIRLPVSCMPQGTLHYCYGDNKDFQSIPLANEIVNEMESLVARLPAADQTGKALRYYAEFAVPEAGYTQRYPEAGTLELFTTTGFTAVDLAVEKPVEPGDVVYDFFWGYGPDKVRQAVYEGYPQRIGPPAMDVADDGRIALMDPVNERIIIFDPKEASYSSFPLPFSYGFFADLAFDRVGRLMVCDYQGEEVEETFGPDPYCYLLSPIGQLVASTPVYIRSPAKMTKDLTILDYSDSRLVAPFNSQGEANAREVQQQKKPWEFPLRYGEGQDPYLAHYADVKDGVVFEVRSASPLGVLTEFAKTPKGYILTFSLGDRLRAVWINSAGAVLKDVTLPKGDYSEINFNGQVAVANDGSLYVMSSTQRGIEIHYVKAP